MQRSAILNVVGLAPGLIGEHTPNLLKFKEAGARVYPVKPVLPAVTCSAQSTYLTGALPSEHGIVGNGWYDKTLSEHHFWKQSNHLVKGEKLWETLRRKNPGYTCAKMFWWYNMYSSADWSITPRPMYPTDGRKLFDVYSHPLALRDEVKSSLGEFPFPSFWGPMAGLPSSRWIADSAMWVEENYRPDLNLVYLPHLDYNYQRFGPSDPRVQQDLAEIDELVGGMIRFFHERDVSVLILSEYGITDVNHVIYPNRVFREKGWIQVKEELGLELLDCGASKAFAITDHQITHIYLNDPEIEGDVRATLESMDGVRRVYDKGNRSEVGLDHERAGDLIAFSDESSWFTYYHWLDDAKAPDFARCVDVHRKYGYDPVELFLDETNPMIKLKIAWRLLQKKLGQRMLMDVIPLNPSLVKGSHGVIPKSKENWAIIIGDIEARDDDFIDALDVHSILMKFCTKG